MPFMFLNISNAASHHETVPSLCKRRGECLLLFFLNLSRNPMEGSR